MEKATVNDFLQSNRSTILSTRELVAVTDAKEGDDEGLIGCYAILTTHGDISHEEFKTMLQECMAKRDFTPLSRRYCETQMSRMERWEKENEKQSNLKSGFKIFHDAPSGRKRELGDLANPAYYKMPAWFHALE